MTSEPEQDQPRKSFANGNAGPQDAPQLEGWVISSAHWWLMA